jgi:hypothetical protein
MTNPYKYLFYKIYSFTKLTPSGKQYPEFLTTMTLSLLVIFNIKSILHYFAVPVSKLFFLFFLFFIFLNLLNYFIFLRGKVYIKIVKEYSKEAKLNYYLGNFLSMLYVIFSIFFVYKK